MSFEESATLAIPGSYLLLLAAEQLWPARSFPRLPFWKLTGVLFFLMMGAVSTLVPMAISPALLARVRLLDLTGLGILGGVVVGVLAVTFAAYWWHRAEHRFDFLWRGFHQLHHSPHRVDLSGFVFTHPLEMPVTILISLGVTVPILGLDPRAAAIVGTLSALYGMVQHVNLKTPRWFAIIAQRPEAHCLHHERGVHARNYSDLPLWDWLFGTLANPARFAGEVGFDAPTDRRILAMLGFRDVNGPAAPLGQKADHAS
jgi:sterol desaturase/sphingolipid hydroxylase (fatty acid hydroxylase superfamily)